MGSKYYKTLTWENVDYYYEELNQNYPELTTYEALTIASKLQFNMIFASSFKAKMADSGIEYPLLMEVFNNIE